MSGTIYFIAGEGCDTVKIGFTADAGVGGALNRMAALQVGSPVRLSLLFCTTGSQGNERALHRRFASFRSHGEWFRMEGFFRDFLIEFSHSGEFIGPAQFEAALAFHCGSYIPSYHYRDLGAATKAAERRRNPPHRRGCPCCYIHTPESRVAWLAENPGYDPTDPTTFDAPIVIDLSDPNGPVALLAV
jgi:hypothetical protein